MKSLKKTLVLLVVFAMILSTVVPAFAATATTDTYGLDCEEEVARLQALKVVAGYEDGSYKPENTITRAEMAVILCKMVGIDEVTCNENKSVPSKFSDVAVGEWYTGYINVAAGKGFLSGFPDGTFRPNDQLTMNQVLTLCVNALGRGEYVSTMGAWPANYITEATKLGLLDGVKTSDANRGNVAIIIWNTLEAPYVWDVTTTEYEGTINLGNSTRNLLSIYFRDYSYDDGNVLNPNRLLKEAEYVEVLAVPATNSDLGENQLTLVATADTDAATFATLKEAIEDTKLPRGTDDKEKTAVNDAGNIVAYAPDFENLDSYFGKVVTVIFGKDNKVVSIRVNDEAIEEYLTAYDKSGNVSTFKIGGTSYKFADDAKVYVNTKLQRADADAALTNFFEVLGIEAEDNEYDEYSKVIKANVVLNTKGKVTRLDLFVSGTYDDFNTVEAVVTKVGKEKLTLQYTTDAKNEMTYDYSDIDEDELPRVIKDEKIVSLDDIEVGNVLTCYYDANKKDLKTIYVSDVIVEGEVTKAKKVDSRIYTEDSSYVPSMIGKIWVTEDKLTEIENKADANDLVGETVGLYLNIYGEYVLALVDDASNGNWTFGYLRAVKDFNQKDDSSSYEAVIRILLPDGTTTSRAYKIFSKEKDINKAEYWDETKKDMLIAFKADGESIDWDDIVIINKANGALSKADEANERVIENFEEKYEVALIEADSAVNDSRKRIYNAETVAASDKNYKFLDKSVIFNVNANELGVSSKWNMLIKNEAGVKKLNVDTLVIVEKDETDILYAIINAAEAPNSDAMYAFVNEDHTKVKEDNEYRYYLKLIDEDNSDAQKLYAANDADAEAEVMAAKKNSFVEYILADDEITHIHELIKVVKFEDLDSDDLVGTYVIDPECADAGTHLVVALVEAADATDEVHGGLVDNVAGEGEVLLATVIADKADGYAEPAVGDHVKLNGDDKYELSNANDALTVVADQVECDGGCGGTCPEYEAAADAVEGTAKVAFKVIETEENLIKYEDDEDLVKTEPFGELEIDEDAIIFDLRDSGFKTITFKELADAVEDGTVYVIPFKNADCEADADANILVVLD